MSAPRPGLIAKKLLVKGKKGTTKRTYWVRPEGAEQTERLARARKEGEKHPHVEESNAWQRIASSFLNPVSSQEMQRRAVVEGPLAVKILAPPTTRRAGELPSPTLPVLSLAPVTINVSSFPHSRSPTGRVPSLVAPNTAFGALIKTNEQELLKLTKSFAGTFSPPGMAGLMRSLSYAPTMRRALATYHSMTGEIKLNPDTTKSLGLAMITKDIQDEHQYRAVKVLTHEILHGAGNRNRPLPEPLGSASQPNRWLEEATTELLANQYVPDTIKAMTGKEMPRENVVKFNSSGKAVYTEVGSYSYQCTRFANLATYIVGAKSSDDPKAVNDAVMHLASEVKRRGQDRFTFLAEEVLKAHKINKRDDTELYGFALVEVRVELSNYMGRALPPYDSNALPIVDSQIAQALRRAIARRAAINTPINYEPAPVVNTPLARVTSSKPAPTAAEILIEARKKAAAAVPAPPKPPPSPAPAPKPKPAPAPIVLKPTPPPAAPIKEQPNPPVVIEPPTPAPVPVTTPKPRARPAMRTNGRARLKVKL